MLGLHYNKDFIALKFGCILPTWPTIANKILRTQNSILSRMKINIFSKESHEDVVGGYFRGFTGETVRDEICFRHLTKVCKTIVYFIVVNTQLYPHSMCQHLTTGLYARWEFDSKIGRFTPRQKITLTFENIAISVFQRSSPDSEIKIFTSVRLKKTACLGADIGNLMKSY